MKEFESLFSRNILTILFGSDLDDTKIEIDFRKSADGGPGSSEFEKRSVIVREALDEINAQVMSCMVQKLLNPLQPIVTFFTRRTRSFTRYQRIVTDNCAEVRSFVRRFIQERKAGGN